jgi:hypothetical protein
MCCAGVSIHGQVPSSALKPDDSFLDGPIQVLFNLGRNAFRTITKKNDVVKGDVLSKEEMKTGGYKRSLMKNVNASEILNMRLWMAAEAGNAKEVQTLLQKGADANWRETRSWYWWAPLHVAAVDGRVEAVDALLAGGADANLQDWDQWTPLHYAAYQGLPQHAAIARRLLDAGADVYEQTWDGRTALALARRHNSTAVAALLEGFERDEARRRGLRPRRNTVGGNGMRKDRERFLQALTRRFAPPPPPPPPPPP